MSPKKIEKKKNKTLKNIQSLVPKNLDLNKLKINPFEIIDETKDIAKVESQPKFEGKQMVMIIQPI